jgi:hypothetical protein
LGHFFAHSTASSIDAHCQIQNPAISSFVSANGPSETVRDVPENFTRFPLELGCSPSPACITPAATNVSLYAVMSDSNCSLGITPASELLSAFTITMNFIVHLLSFDY